jgi:hypothetical protein
LYWIELRDRNLTELIINVADTLIATWKVCCFMITSHLAVGRAKTSARIIRQFKARAALGIFALRVYLADHDLFVPKVPLNEALKCL